MKIENNNFNLKQLKVESPGTERAFRLVKYDKGKIFRTSGEVNRLDQITFSGDTEYYIIFELSKDIDGKDPEFHIDYITLNDYFILKFHSILDNVYLDWQEKTEMVRDLSNEISVLYSRCKAVDF